MLFENEQLEVVCLLDFQGGTSFVDHFCYLCLVYIMLSCLFIATLWSPGVTLVCDVY